MRKPTYSVFDNVSKVFNYPYAAINEPDAVRSFSNSIAKEIPERCNEFALYHNGWYDDTTGVWESMEPTCVFRGSEISELKEEAKKLQAV